MAFPNRDGGQAIQESIHRLHTRLRGGVRGAAGDDDRSTAVTDAKAGRSHELRQSADQPDGRGRAECGPVVLIHLIPESGVANLVQTEKLVEAERAAVRHEDAMKGDGEPRL